MLSRKPPAGGQNLPPQRPAQPSVRPFEVTYPGQEIASSPTNPFPQRPHEVWMGDQHVARKPTANPEQPTPADKPTHELDWNRISLYAEGQPPPPPVTGRGIQNLSVPTLQRDPGNQPENAKGSAKGDPTDDAELQAYLEKWKLPEGSNYQIRGNAIVIRRTWLLQDSAYNPAQGNSHAPTAAAEILQTLRVTGKLSWITDDIIAEAAPQVTFIGTFPEKFSYKAFPISSTVYEIVGPPPTSNEITWNRHGGDGLTYIIHSHLFKKGDVNHLYAVAKRTVDALESFTGLKVLPQYRDELVHILTQQLATAQQEGKKAVAQDVQRIHLEKVFGDAAWAGFVQQPPSESDPDAKEDAKGAKQFAPEVPAADQKFYKDFMKKHFGSAKPKAGSDQPGLNVTPYLIAALRKLDQHPQKALILELMQGKGKKQGEELTAASVENAINAAEMKAAYKDLDLKVPDTSDSDWKPIVKAPVKGEIVNRGGRLHAGESTEFAFEVRDRVDALRVPHLTVKWAATPQDNPTSHIETETCSHIDMPGEKPDYFDVTFDKAGLYTIHAFVYHNFYLPAHFSIPIEVKTEAQRMGELRDEAFAGMGNYQTQKHNFDTSLFNETFGDDKYDKGSKFTGALPQDFKRRSFAERVQFIATERQRLEALIKQYGSSSSSSHQEIAKYASNYLLTLETAEKTLNAENQAGRTFFEVRSTYLSRESGIPDKALHLVCSAKKDGNNVAVTLHDYTKLYEAVDYTFTGDGSTFASALEDAFMDLCKAYPPGRVSLLAETLNDVDLTPAQSTLGFELDSGTAWKSLKSKVFSPVAQIAVNIVGAALMIFAPMTAPVVFPLLVAYNATDTIDNLVQLEAKGNLTWESVAKGVAMIGLDLLPYVGRAKMFMKTGSKALYVIEGIEIAGQVAIMTSEGMNQVEQLRNKDVREIAELEEEIQTLERTNPSHPGLAAKKADLNAKIQAAQDRSVEVFSSMAAQGGMMLVPGVVFTKLAAKGKALKADDLIATGLFEHRAGAQPHFDPATGKAYFDKTTATPEQLEALTTEILKHQQATGQIEKPLGTGDQPAGTTPKADVPEPKPEVESPGSQPGGQAPVPEPKPDVDTPGSTPKPEVPGAKPDVETPSAKPTTAAPQVAPENAIDNFKKGLAGETRHGKVAKAQEAIASVQDFKQLREMVKNGELGDPAQATRALQNARMKVIYDTFKEVKRALKAEFRAKGAKLEIKAKNLGTPGFGSDCDITIQVSGSKNVNDDIAASVKAVKSLYEKLRSRGLDPDKTLDANFYTELHEGKIKPQNSAEASAIVGDQSVVSLAEMRLNMTDDQWQAYVKAQRESLSQGQGMDGPASDVSARSLRRMDEQIQQAEALANNLKQGDRDQLLKDRQQALLDAIERGASAREKRQLMAEIKLLEPDAYGTRAAVEGVVDYQQKIARGDSSTYMTTNRNLPDSKAEQLAVYSQEGSASLGKLSHVTAHATDGANYGGVRSAAKYLNRIHDALFQAGLRMDHPLLDSLARVVKTKQGSHADIYTMRELQNSRWAHERGLTDATDKELCDAFLKEAQELGQQMVVKLRTNERSLHVVENPPSNAVRPSDFRNDVEMQKALYNDAKRLRDEQQAFANNLLTELGIQGGNATSILKREDFDSFVKGVVEKCDRKGYTSVAQMDDIVRGRFNLPDEKSVEAVIAAMNEQTKYDIVHIEFPRREVKLGNGEVGYGYPRYHVILKDPATGLTHEWQIGTQAVTNLYETQGIHIPDALKPNFHIRSDLHDIEYDIFKSVQDKHPDLAKSLGIPEFRARVNEASARAGLGKDQDVKALHEAAGQILQKLVDLKGAAFVEQFYH